MIFTKNQGAKSSKMLKIPMTSNCFYLSWVTKKCCIAANWCRNSLSWHNLGNKTYSPSFLVFFMLDSFEICGRAWQGYSGWQRVIGPNILLPLPLPLLLRSPLDHAHVRRRELFKAWFGASEAKAPPRVRWLVQTGKQGYELSKGRISETQD